MAKHCRGQKLRRRKNMFANLASPELKAELISGAKKAVPAGLALIVGLAAPVIVERIAKIDLSSSKLRGLGSLAITALAGAGIAIAAKKIQSPVSGGRDHAVAAGLGATLALAINGIMLLTGRNVIASAQAGHIIPQKGMSGLGFLPSELLASDAGQYGFATRGGLSDQINPSNPFDAPDALMLQQSHDAGGDFFDAGQGMSDHYPVSESQLADWPHNSFSMADQFSPGAFA
jgi:hypothetical protein